MTETAVTGVLQFAHNELLLFSACGFLAFAVDDFILDTVWVWQWLARTYWRSDPLLVDDLSPQNYAHSVPLAIFVPAWRESEVIEQMLRRCLEVWGDQNYKIFVGVYANDLSTRQAVERVCSPNIICVKLKQSGPTTKADCLNSLWSALLMFETGKRRRFSAVVLHDAEDLVHPGEVNLFSQMARKFALTQIPVIPVSQPASQWISGHYLDEFAESHQKDLPVRQACGASMPSAGTGCAISRAALESISNARNGLPFDSDSLTEDYELGLRIWQMKLCSVFVRHFDSITGTVVAVRSCFPSTIGAAVRQKARWNIGIALAGWDRTGWHGGLLEHWMRWRDRRTILAALFICTAYTAVLFGVLLIGMGKGVAPSGWLSVALSFNLFFFVWRLLFRFGFTARQYGFVEGLRAVPRIFVANVICVMAARRALSGYLQLLITGKVSWDKTEHVFPAHVKN